MIGVDYPEPPEADDNRREGIDLLAAYRTVIRVLAHLESQEYTSGNERQADVVVHEDLPDPAGDYGTSQG